MKTIEEFRNDLRDEGYYDIEATPDGVKVGDRVHHGGEQYMQAWRDGTATVLAIMEKSPSSWSTEWGQPDIELIVERDLPLTSSSSRVSQWADYHTVKVDDHG